MTTGPPTGSPVDGAPAARRLFRDVELRPPNDPEYFPAGVKHRYTRG